MMQTQNSVGQPPGTDYLSSDLQQIGKTRRFNKRRYYRDITSALFSPEVLVLFLSIRYSNIPNAARKLLHTET